jgi:hypothetical protein
METRREDLRDEELVGRLGVGLGMRKRFWDTPRQTRPILAVVVNRTDVKITKS